LKYIRMAPKKTKSQGNVSPAPKDLKTRKSSVPGRIIFWGLLTSMGLMMLACILDYQQGKLADHTSQATKYMVNLASEVPHKLEMLFDSAKGQFIILTGKMHIGDKSVSQLLFGEEIEEEDPTPKDVQEDFKLEDKVEDLIHDQTPLVDIKKVEELARELRKQKELHLYEESKKKMKEEAMKVMENEKAEALATLLEEKEKLKDKIVEETAEKKVLEEVNKELGRKSVATEELIISSTEATQMNTFEANIKEPSEKDNVKQIQEPLERVNSVEEKPQLLDENLVLVSKKKKYEEDEAF